MDRWQADRRVQRRAVFAVGVLAHGVLIGAMLLSRVSHERPVGGPVIEAMIWPVPALSRAPVPAPAPHARVTSAASPPPARRRSIAPPPDSQAIRLAPEPLAQAASAPEPVSSAASQPLRLTLTRDQIKALIAQDTPTLAQLGPHAAKASPYDPLAGEGDGMNLTERPHGVTEVHLHGQCYRLIPTPRAQSDPFNHANERLTGPCLGNF